jgi:N-acetylmuramoyl-L-alanine amidase
MPTVPTAESSHTDTAKQLHEITKTDFMPIHIANIKKRILLILMLTCIAAQGFSFVVVLDAGHGGKDPGALGTYSKEKNINLNVVLRLGKLIKENCRDVTIIYTRQTDKFVELYERANIANNAKADLFISVHTNSTSNNIAIGTETYSLTLDKAATNTEVVKRENAAIQYEANKQRYATNSLENKIMSEVIMGSNMRTSAIFAKLVQDEYKKTGRYNRGVHQQNFHVLRQVAMPSILTELGFISTPSEEAYLNSEQGINELATCIFNAFRKHISPILRDASEGWEEENATNNTTQTKEQQAETRTLAKTEETKKNDRKNTPEVKRQTTPAAPKHEVKTNQTSKSTDKYSFKVQICTSDRRLRKDAEQFKGLDDVNTYPISLPNGKTKFVHTYGNSTSYAEITSIKNKLRAKFNDCFVVVFKGDQKITGEEAAAAFKKQP